MADRSTPVPPPAPPVPLAPAASLMPTPAYPTTRLAAAPTAQPPTQPADRRVLRRTGGGFHAARLAVIEDDAVVGEGDTALHDELPATLSPAAALTDVPPITIEFALSVASRGTETAPVRGVVTLRAPSETQTPRVHADLVFVLDVSGSMAGDKMDMLKRTLRWLASDACLTADDRVAVVAFDDTAWVEMPLRFMNAQGRDTLAAVGGRMCQRGGTEISSGMKKATDMLAARRYVNSSTAVLLMSDGEDHEAKLKSEPIMRALSAVATVRAVGLGVDHDAALLKHIADAARGEYAFANQAADVAPTVGAAVAAATTSVASRLKEMQVTAHFTDGTEKVILTKHELGTMCCGEAKHFCLSTDTPPTRLEAHLEYYMPGAAVTKLVSALKELPEGDGAPAPRETLVFVELQELREATTAAAAEVSRIMQSVHDSMDNAGRQCRDILKAAVLRIESSSVATESTAVALLADLEWMMQGFTGRSWQSHARGAGGGSLAAVLSVQARHTGMRATGSLGGGDYLYATPSTIRTARDAVHATQLMNDDD